MYVLTEFDMKITDKGWYAIKHNQPTNIDLLCLTSFKIEKEYLYKYWSSFSQFIYDQKGKCIQM